MSAAGGRIPVPEQERGWSVGVRPEKIKLGERGLTARVSAIDFLGSETIVRLLYEEQILLAKVSGRAQFSIGDEVTVGWSPEAAHFFNEKGLRIGDSGSDENHP